MIRLVVFDAYGTLFDVYSVGEMAEALFPGKGSALSLLWRDKQIEYSRLISLSDPLNPMGSRHYQSFWDVTRLALQYSCQRLQLELTPAKQKQLMDQYAQLQPFEENLDVLHALKQSGMRCAILSNGSPDMLNSAVASAGMTGLIDKVLSVDEVRQFKTSPQSYGLVAHHYPMDIREVLFVSSNSWDTLGATWFGFKTFWVNRQGLPFETLGPRPNHSGSSLRDILALL
jgi:2-haloacid dehalogenase